MSKTVKNFLIRDYNTRLEGIEDACLISIRGIPALDNNHLRLELAKRQISVTVIRNNLAKHAFSGSGLAALEPLLTGPSAVAYSGDENVSVVDVARELMKWAKQVENLELKGAVIDGELYAGAAGVERLSKFPTREEAQAQAVTLILSPGRKLASAVLGPGKKVASLVKAIEEKLEKGETIAPVA